MVCAGLGTGVGALIWWWCCLERLCGTWRPDRSHLLGVEQLPAIRASVSMPMEVPPLELLRRGFHDGP